jgi:hypothetical protein
MDELVIKYLLNKSKNDTSYLKYDFVCHSTISKYILNPSKNLFVDKLSIYKLYKEIINKNIFLMQQDREKLLTILQEYQRIKFAMYKLQNAFRYKYIYTTFDYNYDMEMNELSRLPKRKLVNIIENNTIYKFSLRDISKIIYTSLNNVEEFVHYPYRPKNPFTNTPLSQTNMINFYFSLLNSGIKVSHSITDYYDMNFNMVKYKNKYRIFVLEQYVKSEFMLRDNKEIYHEIYNMYENSRRYLGITTLKVKPYNKVNDHYIKHMKEMFNKALQYYVMTTILEEEYSHNVYLDKFIREFKKVNLENPGINLFYRFEKQRLDKERYSLFNPKNTTPIRLFGHSVNVVNENNLTTDISNNNLIVNVQEPFAPNPFVQG